MDIINIETQIRSLSKLLDDIRQGYLQIPPFQRDFVWDRGSILDLFDSIKNNYPIGSILVWKPKNELPWKSLKEIGSYRIQPKDSNRKYLLDGYQRLSSLFGCLTNPDKTNLKCNESLRNLLFSIYFDLEEEIFVYIRQNTPKPHQVPVYILMSTSDFRQYSRKYMEPFCDPLRLDKYLDRADSLSRSLVDYKLAVIEISDAPLSDAVNIFSRINSKGSDISFDWMVNALSYSEKFNFAYEIDSLIESLADFNFNKIPRNTLFRCYQSAFDDKLYIDQTDIEKLGTRKDFPETAKRIKPAIIKAVDYLYSNLNVVEYKLLPYDLQLIFFMTFFDRVENPTPEQLKELKNWFWKTTYSNYFTINSISNWRRAFGQFLSYINGETQDILYSDDKNTPFRTLPFPQTILMSSVRSKALILFELAHYRKVARRRPLHGRLYIHKLFSDENKTPENIIPTFANKKKWITEANELAVNLDNDNIPNAFFLPPVKCLSNDSEILAERKKMLMKAEKNFVEEKGLIYDNN